MTHRLLGARHVRLRELPWHTSRNGSQVDINCYVPEERRELTIAADVRENCAGLLAAGPALLAALRGLYDEAVRDDPLRLISALDDAEKAIALAGRLP